jgi:hypothetical protein
VDSQVRHHYPLDAAGGLGIQLLRCCGLGQRGHLLDLGAGEAADDDGVQGAVGREGVLGGGVVGGGDADGALGLAEAVEVIAVALVEVTVEGLLLGEALCGVGADGGADVAEDRRRLDFRAGLGVGGGLAPAG